VAVDLGERAVLSALDAAGIAPDEVDVIVTVSSTGVAVPTIDARLAPAIGLRPDVLSKDVPKMVDVYLGEEVDRFLAD
jgi:alkylresorcinol/alkylpyrone synthase